MEIVRTYFPSRTTMNELWWVNQPNDAAVFIVKYTAMPQGAVPGVRTRDYLRINCAPASGDIHFAWSMAIAKTVKIQLQQQPAQDIFLCVAIGEFFMFFIWDLNRSGEQGMWIQVQGSRHHFDSRLRPFTTEPWLNVETGEINPLCAMSFNADNVIHREAVQMFLFAIRQTVVG